MSAVIVRQLVLCYYCQLKNFIKGVGFGPFSCCQLCNEGIVAINVTKPAQKILISLLYL